MEVSDPITIAVGTAHATNYNLSPSSATLSITPAPTTLTGLTIFTGSNSLFSLAATLTFTRLGLTSGVSGQILTFIATNGTILCTGITDSTGRATCTSPRLLSGLIGNLFGLFGVTYPGASDYQTSKTTN